LLGMRRGRHKKQCSGEAGEKSSHRDFLSRSMEPLRI
jgi:hypothetical protein